MEMLKSPRPEPPTTCSNASSQKPAARLLRKPAPKIVLGPTDHLRAPTIALQPFWSACNSRNAQPAFASAKVIPFRTRITNSFRSLGQTMLQPRLAMTAAMAFFSIALTLNLTGVRLSDLRASDFKPSSIMRSASQAKASVVRNFDNLRVVYELESRVRDCNGPPTITLPAPPRPPRTIPTPRNPTIRIRSQAPRNKTRSRPSPIQAPAAAKPPAAFSWFDLFLRRSPPSPPGISLYLLPSVFKQEGGLV